MQNVFEVVSHEAYEAITNPYGSGWYDPNAECEIGDVCNGTVTYLPASNGGTPWCLQALWGQARNRCETLDAKFFPSANGVAATVSEPKRRVDAFFVGPDGRISQDSVDGYGDWFSNGSIGSGLPFRARVSAGSQVGTGHIWNPSQLDLFVSDNLGALHLYWSQGSGWSDLRLTPPEALIAGTTIATAIEGTTQLDALYVDANGTLDVDAVDGMGGWTGQLPISAPGRFPPGAEVAAGLQADVTGTSVDAFAVDKNGALQYYQSTGTGPWKGPIGLAGNGFAPPGAHLLAHHQSPSELDLFVVGNDRRLWVFYANGFGAWSSGRVSETAEFLPGTIVAAGPQFGQILDALAVDAHGSLLVFSVANGGGWTGPYTIAPPGTYSPAASVVAFPQGTQLDALVDSRDGTPPRLYAVNGLDRWRGPFALP